MNYYNLRVCWVGYEKEQSEKILTKEDLKKYFNDKHLEDISDKINFEDNFLYAIPIRCGNDRDLYTLEVIEHYSNFLDLYIKRERCNEFAADCETTIYMLIEVPYKYIKKTIDWDYVSE